MSALLVVDLDSAVGAALDALRPVVDHDWHVPARDLRWTCWETLEHVADDLFAYAGQIVMPTTGLSDYVPFVYESAREGGPECTIHSQPEQGNAGLLDVVATCGALLSSARAAAATAEPAEMQRSAPSRAVHWCGTLQVNDATGRVRRSQAPSPASA